MALRLAKGTIEYVIVDLADRTGLFTDLTGHSPVYTMYKPDGVTTVYNAAAASISTYASGTLTSDGTNVANNDTVTIGGIVYTFKTTLTPNPGEILIGTNAADSLQNLKYALADTVAYADIKYGSGTSSFWIPGTLTSTTLDVRSSNAGAAGNLYTTTETSAHLSWGSGTFSGGTWDSNVLEFRCLIDTTVTNPISLALVAGTYTLYVGFTNSPESPRLGPIEIIIS
jgi:hypothetical protein